MTRETKIGLLVGLAFIIVIGILLSDHLTSTTEPPQARLTQAGNNVRQGVSVPGATTANPPVTTIVAPAPVTPQQPIPMKDDLANLLYQLADERFSRRIARKIADARRVSPIKSTEQLADLVRAAIPKRGGAPGKNKSWKDRSEKIDPATRTFMALRMAVNDELPNLSALLERAPKALRPGGRFAVISFHSTEDRVVKLAFRSAEQTGLLKILTKKPFSPADDELARNPRSRSAKLRVAEKQ